jgi:hypothetical protein
MHDPLMLTAIRCCSQHNTTWANFCETQHTARCSGARRILSCGMASRPTAPACLTVLRPAVHVWRVRWIRVRLFNFYQTIRAIPAPVSRRGSSVWMLGTPVAVRDALSADAGSRQRTGLWYMYVRASNPRNQVRSRGVTRSPLRLRCAVLPTVC